MMVSPKVGGSPGRQVIPFRPSPGRCGLNQQINKAAGTITKNRNSPEKLDMTFDEK
jgi:hypothetical protein